MSTGILRQAYDFDCMVEREENPHEAEPLVRRMIDSVPRKYLVGLKSVVLTNSNGLSRKRRKARFHSRKRKFGLDRVRGLYHPAYRGHPPWIEIFVDNCFRGYEKWWWHKVPFLREDRLSDVLFHEIGHHIHYTVRPEYREKEDVADVWKVRLESGYLKQRYRCPRIIAKPIRLVFGGLIDRMRVWSTSDMFKNGLISQAEYMEEMKGIKKASDSH